MSRDRNRIFIVEDHPTLREGLMQILGNEPDLVVCGQAGTAEEAGRAIRRLKPDLVLLDISLPGKSGLELIRELRAKKSQVKILVLSMHDEALYATRVLRAGGDGYIMKQENPEEIVRAIREVLAGQGYVSAEVLARPPEPAWKHQIETKAELLDQLSDLELQILELLGFGKTKEEIARHMRLAVSAVVRHCTRMKGSLGLESDNALIRYAVCWVEADRG